MIVVTGGAGFIGSNVVARLCERGFEVAVCDRLGDGEKWRNLAKHPIAALVPPERLEAVLDPASTEAVVHMGAISDTTATDGEAVMATNLALSLELWRWCAAHGKRLIYASSAATYGDGAAGFDDDAAALDRLRPQNLYAFSKHLFDRQAVRLAAAGAAPAQWVGLKFFNVYGPNEYHKGAMRSLIAKAYGPAARGEPVTLFRSHRAGFADGEQRRDFVYVADCVAVIEWLLDHPEVNGLYNVGSGRGRTFLDLVGALFRALGREPRVVFVDMPETLRDRYQYATEAAMARLRATGYDAPFAPVEDGVADYVSRFLATPDPYR